MRASGWDESSLAPVKDKTPWRSRLDHDCQLAIAIKTTNVSVVMFCIDGRCTIRLEANGLCAPFPQFTFEYWTTRSAVHAQIMSFTFRMDGRSFTMCESSST